MLRKHSQFLENLLLVTDLLIIAATWIGAYYLRHNSILHVDTSLSSIYIEALVPILLIWPFIFKNMGLYRPRRIASHLSEFFDIARASTLAVVVLIVTTFFVKRHDFSRLVFIYFWLISMVALTIERLLFREVLRYSRRLGYNTRQVLIIGAGDLGGKVARKLRNNRWTGLVIAGYLDDKLPKGEVVEGEKVIGRISEIEEVFNNIHIDQVFVALPITAYKRLIYVVQSLSDKMVDVKVVPDIYQAITLNASIEMFDGLPIINLTDTPMYGWSVVLKRLADIVCSSLAIIILVPIMASIALAIKFTSPGPVIFKQRRYGLDGKIIWVYKFRSMTVCEDGESVPQAQKCDPRITPLGAFLRKSSLDELPQFFNVIKGEMSIVGPRPHAIAHNEHYRNIVKRYMLRHRVKPGITGWAQVNGWRGETDTLEKMEKRIDYDLYYIENWSIWLDIKIMWLTVWKGLVNKNAY